VWWLIADCLHCQVFTTESVCGLSVSVCMSARVCVVVHRCLPTVPCLAESVSAVRTERDLLCMTVGHRARFAVSDSRVQSEVCCA